MTLEEATLVVTDHLAWLEGEGHRQTVATAIKTLLFEVGKLAGGLNFLPKETEDEDLRPEASLDPASRGPLFKRLP